MANCEAKGFTAEELRQFSGTDNWYKHGLVRSVLYTDGAKFVAERAGAYWLLDEIATGQMVPRVRRQEFQVWKLTVNEDSSARLVCEDGNDNTVYVKLIPFTDFPPQGVTLWCEKGEYTVILLPSEH